MFLVPLPNPVLLTAYSNLTALKSVEYRSVTVTQSGGPSPDAPAFRIHQCFDRGEGRSAKVRSFINPFRCNSRTSRQSGTSSSIVRRSLSFMNVKIFTPKSAVLEQRF